MNRYQVTWKRESGKSEVFSSIKAKTPEEAIIKIKKMVSYPAHDFKAIYQGVATW